MSYYKLISLTTFLIAIAMISVGCTGSSGGGKSSYPTASTIPTDDDDDDTTGMDADEDGFDETADCNDNDATINPDQDEIAYDGIDQDCDGEDLTDVDGDGVDAEQAGGDDCDDADANFWQLLNGYTDTDLDGYGAGAVEQVCSGDALPAGYSTSATDCNDTAADQFPTNTEINYDGVDQDCDGFDICDVDGDGYYSLTVTSAASCQVSLRPGDCDDNDSQVYPTRAEIAYDGIDQDCDDVDLCDQDEDGYYPAADVANEDMCADSLSAGDCNDSDEAINPGVEELCGNDIDDNCDSIQCSAPGPVFCSALEVFPANNSTDVPINEVINVVCTGDYFPDGTAISISDEAGNAVMGNQQFYNCNSAANETCGAWQFQKTQMWQADTKYTININYGSDEVGTWFITAAADPTAAGYVPVIDNRFTDMPAAYFIEHTAINKPEGMAYAIENDMMDLLTWYNEATVWLFSAGGFPNMNAAYTESEAIMATGRSHELETSNNWADYSAELDHSSNGRMFTGNLFYDAVNRRTEVESNGDSSEIITVELFYGLPVSVQGYTTTAAFGDIPGTSADIDVVDGHSTAKMLNCQATCDDLTAMYSAEYPGIEMLCEESITVGPFTDDNPVYICNDDDTMDYDMEWIGYYNPVSETVISAPVAVSSPTEGVYVNVLGARWDAAKPTNHLAEETITLLIHSPDDSVDVLRSTDYADSIDHLGFDCPTGEPYCEFRSIFFELPANFRNDFNIPEGSYCDVEIIVGLQYASFRKVKF